jgi:hypothetical protein
MGPRKAKRMKHSHRVLVSILVSLWCMAPQAARAQESLTAEQVQGAFASRGYAVEESIDWNWLSPPSTTFRVRDVAGDRVLLAIVYADSATATAEQSKTHVLIRGYGPRAWWQNVALVQSSDSELRRLFAAELECDLGMGCTTPFEVQFAAPVSAEFLAALANRDHIDL